jgi:DNA (cytosine-5)-methyltransferase 1
MSSKFTAIELCAGGGGQAIGLERAGFSHAALIEIEPIACETLRTNRPAWNIIQSDLRTFSTASLSLASVDLVAGGVPCPPFSMAGKQLGADDERDLFPEALRIVDECRPRAVMLENVRGLLGTRFDGYRDAVDDRLIEMGYTPFWNLLQASDFGVAQLRPRAVLVAIENQAASFFSWPKPSKNPAPSVGEVLESEMTCNGWELAASWAAAANTVAPTLVGGSKKHGGPDLGPTRAKREWRRLGVCGKGIADGPPEANFEGMPRLTVKMAALLQGFPEEWVFAGKKTAAYRQVGNAFPPPVAEAVATQIRSALRAGYRRSQLATAA